MRKYLVLVALFSMLLMGCSQSPQPSTKPSGIPIYGNAELYTAPTIYSQMIGIPSEGVNVKAYHVKNAKIREILEWYKEKLSDYEVVQDITTATMSTAQGTVEYGMLILKKGNEGVGVWAVSGEGEVVYFLATGPVDKFGTEGYSEPVEGQLPSSDVASGEEPIERYPGSVMLSYYRDDTNPVKPVVDIDYGTKDSPEKVVQWYKTKLTSQGWKLEDQYSDEYSLSLYFTKKGGEIGIYIERPSDTTPYTTISGECILVTLPSNDVVSGEEPVERYPGSVMLSHFTSTTGTTSGVHIIYGSADDMQTVYNWYVAQLKTWGWDVKITGSENGEYTVIATKDGSTLTIMISPLEETYTKIELNYASSY